MKKDNPCRECTNRTIGCHSDCDKYNQWCKEHQQMKDEIRRKRDELNCVNNYSFHAGERIKKQKGMNRK
jgi:hypothetical protein